MEFISEGLEKPQKLNAHSFRMSKRSFVPNELSKIPKSI